MQSGPRRPIIVADDDAALRGVMAEVLDEAGFMVFAAASGDEVLNLVKQGIRPCLFICDVRMPGLTVDELLAQLAENSRTREIPVALVTGGPTADLPDVACVLQKPFRLEVLLDFAREAVAQAEARHRASLAG
jgi:CheY-like chemotaxis protein